MTNCTRESFDFPDVKKRVVEVNFEGGDITSCRAWGQVANQEYRMYTVNHVQTTLSRKSRSVLSRASEKPESLSITPNDN